MDGEERQIDDKANAGPTVPAEPPVDTQTGVAPPASAEIAGATAESVAGATEIPRSKKLLEIFRRDEYFSKPIDRAPVDVAANLGKDVEPLRVILINLLTLDRYNELEIQIVKDFLAQLWQLHKIGEPDTRLPSFYLERYFDLIIACRERYCRTPTENPDFAGFLDELVKRIRKTVSGELNGKAMGDNRSASFQRLRVLMRLAEQTGAFEEKPDLMANAAAMKQATVLKHYREFFTVRDSIHPPEMLQEHAEEIIHAADEFGVTLPLDEAQATADSQIAAIEQKLQEAGILDAEDTEYEKNMHRISHDIDKYSQVLLKASHFPSVVIRRGKQEMAARDLLQIFEYELREIKKKPVLQELDRKLGLIKSAMHGDTSDLRRNVTTFFSRINWHNLEQLGLRDYLEEKLRELIEQDLAAEIQRVAGELGTSSGDHDAREKLISRLSSLSEIGDLILRRAVR